MTEESGRKGPDLEAAVTLTLAEVVLGVAKDVTVRTAVQCLSCNASGALGDSSGRCKRCNGTGQQSKVTNSILGQMVSTVDCSDCQGIGVESSYVCSDCSGEGRVVDDQTYVVDIPKGVGDGATLRLGGRGAVGRRGGKAGDLYIQVTVQDDQRFERRDLDLYLRKPVDLSANEAGDVWSFPWVDGRAVECILPLNLAVGQRIRLEGKGVPKIRSTGAEAGDLYFEVGIAPDNLSTGYIFVSYSAQDSEYVNELVGHFQELGVVAWIAKSDIDYGSNWVMEVRNKIDSCAAFVIVMSQNAETSPWVHREIQRAEDRLKPIYPLLLEGEKFFRLGEHHYEDVTSRCMPSERFLETLRKDLR